MRLLVYDVRVSMLLRCVLSNLTLIVYASLKYNEHRGISS
jgi:hypothetical protein